MSNQVPSPPPGFDALPTREQLEYVHSLWERIIAREHEVPVPAAHQAELQQRLADHHADPGGVRPAADAESSLRDALAQRRTR
jgi:putative addiction module component (TIGR02574 family)